MGAIVPPPLCLLKLVIKEMATMGGELYLIYFMSPSDYHGSDGKERWFVFHDNILLFPPVDPNMS